MKKKYIQLNPKKTGVHPTPHLNPSNLFIFVCFNVRSQLRNPLTDLPQILIWKQKNVHISQLHKQVDFDREHLVCRQSWVSKLVTQYLTKSVYFISFLKIKYKFETFKCKINPKPPYNQFFGSPCLYFCLFNKWQVCLSAQIL